MDIREEDLGLVLRLGCPNCRDNRLAVTHDGNTYHPVIGTHVEDGSDDRRIVWGQATEEPLANGSVVRCSSCGEILYTADEWTDDIAMAIRLHRAGQSWTTKTGYIKGGLGEGLTIKKPIPIEVWFGEHDVAAVHIETEAWGRANNALSAIDELKRKLVMYCNMYRDGSRPGTYANTWKRFFEEHIEEV